MSAAALIDIEPLLVAMNELTRGYAEAMERAQDLVDSLARGDVEAVHAAVAAQTALLATVEAAERRRRAAESAVARSLAAQGHVVGTARAAVTCSDLLAMLHPREAERLRQTRHDLVGLLVGLQAVNRQATMLLRNAQAVINRVVCATTPHTVGYGSRGELTGARPEGRRRVARLA